MIEEEAKLELLEFFLSKETNEDFDSELAGNQSIINELSVEDLASLIESLPGELRIYLTRMLSKEVFTDLLCALGEDTAEHIFEQLEEDEQLKFAEELDDVHLIKLLEVLPENIVDLALRSLNAKERQRVIDAQSYTEDQVGRYIEKYPFTTSEVVTARLLKKRMSKLDSNSFGRGYFVVKKSNQSLMGVIAFSKLCFLEDTDRVEDHLQETQSLPAEMNLEDAADVFYHAQTSVLPVVGETGGFHGVLEYRNLVDLLNERAEQKRLQEVGVDEDDLFAPVREASQKRALWLGINLVTALLASWVIGLFEATLSQVVALAVLMPIVASMGGIAGSQTLTVTIRGLSLGTLTDVNFKHLLEKEIRIAMINAAIWSLVIAVIVAYWFDDFILSAVIFAAIVVNVLVAAASGAVIPLVLSKLQIDPAISGSVILTTVTDVIGFFCFLGLGSAFLVSLGNT